jgi:hypothetical protein
MKLKEIFPNLYEADKSVSKKVFYHGTPHKFEHFDLDYIGKGNDQEGPGFYFTDDINTARGYAGKNGVILACELFPRKIIKSVGKINLQMVDFMITNAPDYETTLQNWDENIVKAYRIVINQIVKKNNPKETFEQIWYDFYRYDAKQWAINMMKFSYDAVLAKTQNDGFGRHIVMLNPEKIKIVDRLSPLNEIELGGELVSTAFDKYKDDLEKADYSGHKQYDLFPEIPTLTLPAGYERVGHMDEYQIVRKKAPYQDRDRRGFQTGTLPGYMYILVKNAKPIGYCYTVQKSPNQPDLQGKGLMTKTVYVEDSERGKNLALKFYYWLLTHVCDYLIPDDTHTYDGSALWRRLNQSSKFDMYVYNPETGMSRKRWAGKDWNQIYNNDYLQPFLCLKGRWVDTDEYESQFEDDANE